MNKLVIGLADKSEALIPTQPGFLLIDDGPIADVFAERFKRAKTFDPTTTGLNPLPLTYRQARDFAEIAFGEYGKETLTVRRGKTALTPMLMDAVRLDKVHGGKSDPEKEALSIIDDILLSPVLRKMFRRKTPRWLMSGASIIARVNRAELGDHDARILGAVLISQFDGQIIVPDFGFYARDFHSSLIREGRLIAGVHSLSELTPNMRNLCLLMEQKDGLRCTYDDAETLAQYAGLMPHTEGFNAFVQRAME